MSISPPKVITFNFSRPTLPFSGVSPEVRDEFFFSEYMTLLKKCIKKDMAYAFDDIFERMEELCDEDEEKVSSLHNKIRKTILKFGSTRIFQYIFVVMKRRSFFTEEFVGEILDWGCGPMKAFVMETFPDSTSLKSHPVYGGEVKLEYTPTH